MCEAAPTLLGPTGVILGSACGGEGLGAGCWFSFCQLAVLGMNAPLRNPQDAPVLLPAGNAQGGGSKLGLAQVICAVQTSAPLGLGRAAPDQGIPSLFVAAVPQEQCRAGGSGQGCSCLSLAQLWSVGAPQGSGMAKWVAWPWAEPAWRRALPQHVRALALGEAENNQSRQRRAGLTRSFWF